MNCRSRLGLLYTAFPWNVKSPGANHKDTKSDCWALMAFLFKGKWHEHSKLEMKYVKDNTNYINF